MKYLELTFDSPAENLACDEVLLDALESGRGGEVLRFWESPRHFIVLGYGNQVATEVNRHECERRDVPILRRCSGGGTVLQGPGCLNYTLVLKSNERGLENITIANRVIMETNRAALERALGRPVAVRGHTDLVLGDLKFSGNAQRRRRRALLFHGSFLLRMDLELMAALLPMPSKQPDYRANRAHETFVRNLNVDADRIRDALREAWDAREKLEFVLREEVSGLVRDRYGLAEWNFRF